MKSQQTFQVFEPLYQFVANQNQFSGPIPSGITRYLRFLDLSFNKVRESIPSDFLSPLSLVFVDLSYNMLDGAIPETMSVSLVRLRLGSNLLNGSIPSPFPTLRKLTYLELDNISLSSTIPTGLGLYPSLALLNLAQNKLTSLLPKSLGNLKNLQVLKLQRNNLGGDIPVKITLLPKLWNMNISWNSLNGTIPPLISNLQALSHLNLQGNNLTRHHWYHEFSARTTNWRKSTKCADSLAATELADCFESEQQPLSGIYSQHLSRPRDLEVLDLSSNKFTGGIPDFVAQMGSLTLLILSNNQLFGVIHEFKPFVYFNVTRNAGLISMTNANTRPGSVEKKKLVALAVILTVVVTSLIAGVGMFVTLLLSRRFLKVNDHESQQQEELPQVIQGNLLTANGIHRSNIDFSKTMEVVTDPLNIALKTRFCTYYKATMPSGASYFVKKLN